MAAPTPDAQVALLNKLMREQIQPHLPADMGATLMLFQQRAVPLGTQGLTLYISTANRDDMAKHLRDLLDRWSARGT